MELKWQKRKNIKDGLRTLQTLKILAAKKPQIALNFDIFFYYFLHK